MARRSKPSPDGDARSPRRRATTVAPEGRLVLAESAGNSRLFIYMLGNYLHRIERERRTVYFGDLDLARVAEIIGAAGVEPGMRDAAFRAQHGSFDSIVGKVTMPVAPKVRPSRAMSNLGDGAIA